jgi:MYXO-CTERM domain-containing protein
MSCDVPTATCVVSTSQCDATLTHSVPRDTSKTPQDCGAYLCDPSSGACRASCTTSDQCNVGSNYVCDVTGTIGKCVQASGNTTSSGGCAMTAHDRARGEGTLATMAFVALGLVRRRRARR